jgi:hypothetical protein
MSKRTVEEEIKTPDFGQIPFHLICRFDELTKFEIRVLCVLYAARNEKTRLCNPRRKKIAEWTPIDRANLSRAVSGLEKKGWIVELETKEFLLIENPAMPDEKVVESTTKNNFNLLSNQQQKVVESTTTFKRNLNIKRTYKTEPLSETSSDEFVGFDFKVDVEAYGIFKEWQKTLNKQKSEYDEKRQKIIVRARDKYKFSIEELKTAIKGVSLSPWHLGHVNGTKYLEFKTIFADRERIEKFIELAEETIFESEPEEQNDQQKAYQAMLRDTKQVVDQKGK